MSVIDSVLHPTSLTRWSVALGILALFTPGTAVAIPPPDFVVNAGMQIAQVFGVALFFCSTGIAFLMRKFRASIQSPLLRAVIVLLLIGGFGLSWYLYLST